MYPESQRKKVLHMKMNRRNSRSLYCPVCRGGRIIDIAANVNRSSVMLYGPDEAENAQFFCKCGKCKQQIGVALRVS